MVRIQSAQPKKQRKSRYNAPLHQRGRYLHAGLEKGLRDQYKRRAIRIIKGDTVRVLRGDHAGQEGVVDKVDTVRLRIIVHGISVNKADGTEVPRPVDPSNLRITKLNLEDPRREAKIGGRS